MVTALERKTATVIDRRDNTAPQGIFPMRKFDHLEGKTILAEETYTFTSRDLAMWAIYNHLTPGKDRGDSKTFTEQHFVQSMRKAFLHSVANADTKHRRIDETLPDGKIRIYSRPKTKGVRVTIINDYYSEKMTIDLTRDNVSLTIYDLEEHEGWEIEESDFDYELDKFFSIEDELSDFLSDDELSEFLSIEDDLYLDPGLYDREKAQRVRLEVRLISKAIFSGGEEAA